MRTPKTRTHSTDSVYRSLFEAIEPCLIVNGDGCVESVNESFGTTFGWSEKEFSSKGLSLLTPKKELPQGTRAFDPSLSASEGVREDILVQGADAANAKLCEVQVIRISPDKSFMRFRDIEARREIETSLLSRTRELKKALVTLESAHAELQAAKNALVLAGKLAALGELVAGVSHELNQPLQGILGYAQELEAELGKSAPTRTRELLSELFTNARKMAEILKEFRNFASGSTTEETDVDVIQVMEDALKLLSKQFQAHGIRIERDYPDNPLPKLRANPTKLEQVFINLGANARDAIHSTGRGEGTIRVAFRGNEESIELSFRDDGCGMSEETKKKIFNPFFTTKEVGKGMGIGLSISHGILESLKASVLVESRLGQFTEFKVVFPLKEKAKTGKWERRSA